MSLTVSHFALRRSEPLEIWMNSQLVSRGVGVRSCAALSNSQFRSSLFARVKLVIINCGMNFLDSFVVN